MKTIEPPQATKESKTDSITVTPFIVPVEWVEITVQIPANIADELDRHTNFIRSYYGRDVRSIASMVRQCANEGDSPTAIHKRLKARGLFLEGNLLPPRGRRLRAITINMQKWWWDGTSEAAKLLDVTAPALVRACLLERARELREFDRAQAEGKGGAA